ncbi:Crp/Fnr family transcriptional regulator, partial [Streptomyces rubellomurinus subsp. indigoferus]
QRNKHENQIRMTIEARRERQEHERINKTECGRRGKQDVEKRIQTHAGATTPDERDDMLARRRDTDYWFAHPGAIAAVERECNRLGVYPGTAEVLGKRRPAWRGVPIFPC